MLIPANVESPLFAAVTATRLSLSSDCKADKSSPSTDVMYSG